MSHGRSSTHCSDPDGSGCDGGGTDGSVQWGAGVRGEGGGGRVALMSGRGGEGGEKERRIRREWEKRRHY